MIYRYYKVVIMKKLRLVQRKGSVCAEEKKAPETDLSTYGNMLCVGSMMQHGKEL